MNDEHRAIQLQQLANIVIDAYVNRSDRPQPEFGEYNPADDYEPWTDHRARQAAPDADVPEGAREPVLRRVDAVL
jgi:hypothetical protein